MHKDDDEEYWVVVVNRSSGFTETFGPYNARAAHMAQEAADERTTFVAVVGRR